VNLEWDPKKATKNVRKHGVDFHEAGTALEDPLSTTYPDPDHSVGEHRFLTIGQSAKGRVIIVSHTDRRNAVRIISARPATAHERKSYEEGQ